MTSTACSVVSMQKKAYADNAFRTSDRGCGPSAGERYFAEPSGKVINESFEVGNRKSRIYWRIYNKLLSLGSICFGLEVSVS